MTLRYLMHCIRRAPSPRLYALEERVAALEASPFQYAGTWESGEYVRGEFVSLRGSLWHCNHSTTSRPGTDESWTLAVKHGRDGRDAR